MEAGQVEGQISVQSTEKPVSKRVRRLEEVYRQALNTGHVDIALEAARELAALGA